MKTVRCLVLLFCFASAMQAKSKEFTILGGQKIKAPVEQGMPLPAVKDGVKIEVAAFMVGDGELIFTFGFTTKTKPKPKRVLVEDVSGTSAVVLVEDVSPVLEEHYWKGDAKPLPLSKTGVPWVFERGDTTKVFRFTITFTDRPQASVLYQPAIYAGETKKQLQQMAR